MTWTFDETLPTAKDRVRRAVGDTVEANPLRTDEEILAVLVIREQNENAAIGDVASGLAVQYAQKPDSITDDGTSISWRDRVKTWIAIADAARAAVIAVTGVGGVWSDQVYRFDTTAEAEYDPNRIDPSW